MKKLNSLGKISVEWNKMFKDVFNVCPCDTVLSPSEHICRIKSVFTSLSQGKEEARIRSTQMARKHACTLLTSHSGLVPRRHAASTLIW